MEKEPQFNSPEKQEKKELFEEVVFSEEKDKDGNITGYRSSSPDRKSIKLSPDSPRPTPGGAYTVEILEDTDPEDPTKGKYVGRIVEGFSSAVYQEKGGEIEERVNEAEKAKRRSRKASADIYGNTGKPKSERGELDEDEIEDEILELAKNKRVVKKALQNESVFENLAEETLGPEDSPERALVGLRWENLKRALRMDREIEFIREQLIDEESQILGEAGDDLSGSELEALEEVRSEMADLEQKREQLLQATPEAYYGLHLKEMKEYRREINEGRIVETPYVKEKEGEIVSHVRAGIPVMLHGHLGSGKTELAMHVSKKMLQERTDRLAGEWVQENPDAGEEERAKRYEEIEREYGGSALVVSGSKHTTLAELYGHQVLDMDKVDSGELEKFSKEVEEKFREWESENPDATEYDKNRAHQRILDIYTSQLQGGTVSDFFMGPVYRAAEEGRPLIIDEVNAIPHEVLISLNHILTRKPGDRINVQQDSGREVVIKDGFGVIMTGNLNRGSEQYVDRQDLDPAFLSRLHKMEYDYLPQKTEGLLEEEAGEGNELFHLMLASVMDKNGNVEAPEDTPKKLWNLAKAARVIQDVFAGREVGSAHYFQEAGGRAGKPILQESVLSIRAIENILQKWREDGFNRELDFYIWQNFVSEATVPAEKAYLYQLLKDRFNFFQGSGWEQNPDYGSGGVVGSFEVKPPANEPAERKFFGPRDTIDLAFGEGPERTEWPKSGREDASSPEAEKADESLQYLQHKKDVEDFLGDL